MITTVFADKAIDIRKKLMKFYESNIEDLDLKTAKKIKKFRQDCINEG